jgi:hypothetical protein
MDIKEYSLRAEADFLPEQKYLRERVLQIEKSLGKVAAKLPPGTLSQPMDALDRARELAGDMAKQVRVRPLAEAVGAQKAWLERARTNMAAAPGQGEPPLHFNRIDLDLRLLDELLAGWNSKRN